MRLSEIARLAPVRVVRDAQFEDLGLLGSADDAILVYLVEEHAIRRLERTPGAVAVITTAELADRVPSGLGLAVADRAEDAFYAAHAALMEKTEFYWKSFPTEIHPTASVHQRAWIEPRNVRIGPRAVIEPHVTIFERVVVGEDSVVRAGTVIGSEGFEFKGPAMRQGRNPGGGAAQLRIEPRCGTPDVEQHLLRDLLGLGRVAQHLPDDAVDRAGEFGIDELERPMVAARHLAQQRGEVRRQGLRVRLGLPLTYLRPAHDPVFEAAGPPDWSRLIS